MAENYSDVANQLSTMHKTVDYKCDSKDIDS